MASHISVHATAPAPHLTPRRRNLPRQGPGIAFDTHILIIDDDRRASIALAFMLGVRGYDEIRSVRSSLRALTIAKNFIPGIIFLDLELPKTDTLNLAQQLRNGSGTRIVRLIALTSNVEHPLREDARRAGFERFLVKPCEQAEIDKILRLPADNGM